MKLATLADGSRDGQLVVVSSDLAQAHHANGIASTLQAVLDDWNFLSPQLEDLAVTLNGGKARHAFAFDPRRCLAPLPRAYQWVVAAAGPEADDEGEGAGAGEASLQLRQLPSDDFGPPVGETPFPPAGADPANPDPVEGVRDAALAGAALPPPAFEFGVAAITGDVAAGCRPGNALDTVRLLTLFVVGGEGPVSAFAPLAVTPDEVGTAWRAGRVHLPVDVQAGGAVHPGFDAGAAATPHFGALIARLARARRLRAGSHRRRAGRWREWQ